MMAMAAAGGGLLAHSAHLAIVTAGSVALGLVLVTPEVLERAVGGSAEAARQRRVADLRERAARGTLAVLAPPVPAPLGPVRDDPRSSALALPVLLLGTAGAAGVHAAVTPGHLLAQPHLAAFFAGCAVAQLVWAGQVLRRCGARLVVAGLLLHLALLILWVASRTTGLPGVLPAAEPVGAWDLAAAAYALVVVGGCLGWMRGPRSPVAAAWEHWHGAARAVAVAVVTTLALVASSGVGA